LHSLVVIEVVGDSENNMGSRHWQRVVNKAQTKFLSPIFLILEFCPTFAAHLIGCNNRITQKAKSDALFNR
jgi:hypothetical protein